MDVKKFKHRLLDCDVKSSEIIQTGVISKSKYYRLLKGIAIPTLKEAKFFKNYLNLNDKEFEDIFLNH